VDHKQKPVSHSRRRWFAAAGTVGAAAAVVSVLPTPPAAPAAQANAALPKPKRGGGYQVSAHVERYYDTARV